MQPLLSNIITQHLIRFDLEDAFSRIGRVRDVWVARKPPGFAFIEMEVTWHLMFSVFIPLSKLSRTKSNLTIIFAGQEGRDWRMQGTWWDSALWKPCEGRDEQWWQGGTWRRRWWQRPQQVKIHFCSFKWPAESSTYLYAWHSIRLLIPIAGAHTEEGEAHQGGAGAAARVEEGEGAGGHFCPL